MSCCHQLLTVYCCSYDFHGGSFEKDGPLNVHTPIVDCNTGTSARFDIETAVQHYLNSGVPGAKLTLGLATYGRTWTVSNAASAAINSADNVRGSGPAGECTIEPGVLAYYEIAAAAQNVQRDGTKMAAYASYGSDGWVGYDDPVTLGWKVSE